MTIAAIIKTKLKQSSIIRQILDYLHATRYQRTYFDRNLNWFQRCIEKKNIDVIKALPTYAPFAEGNCSEIAQLSLQSAQQVAELLPTMAERLGILQMEEPIEAEQFCQNMHGMDAAPLLKQYFDEYGSDKSRTHNYHLIYGALMRDPSKIDSLLEIGLGTNNTDVVSTMGEAGKPGASLRAFRQFLPNALISGADIDRRVLFEEERIKTYFVDQTNLSTFDELAKSIKEPFDIIIDDGLHSPNANLTVLIFSISHLKVGGWIVIEDIKESALPIFRTASCLLAGRFHCHIVKTKVVYVFLAHRI